MKCFKVSEPYSVYLNKRSPKYKKGTNTKPKTQYYRSIKKWGKDEWEKTGIANKKGCYIYFWHNTPIYVGMTVAENGFQNECFHPHKTGDKKGNGILTAFLRAKKVKKCKTKKESPMQFSIVTPFYFLGRT